MQQMVCSVAAVAVALVFVIWQTYRQILLRRNRKLRDRVAYMLWVVAEEGECPDEVTAGGNT